VRSAGYINRVPASGRGYRQVVFTCVWWQVTLCDPIRHVTPHSSEMSFISVLFLKVCLCLRTGNPFPSSFEVTVKKIHRLLLHVLAHVYQCHSRHLVALRLHGHVNTLTYHFMLFSKQFALVDDKELDVLDDLYNRLRHHHSTVRRPTCADSTVPDDSATTTTTATMATGSAATNFSSLAIDDLLQPTTPDTVLARILADDSNKENIVMTATVSI